MFNHLPNRADGAQYWRHGGCCYLINLIRRGPSDVIVILNFRITNIQRLYVENKCSQSNRPIITYCSNTNLFQIPIYIPSPVGLNFYNDFFQIKTWDVCNRGVHTIRFGHNGPMSRFCPLVVNEKLHARHLNYADPEWCTVVSNFIPRIYLFGFDVVILLPPSLTCPPSLMTRRGHKHGTLYTILFIYHDDVMEWKTVRITGLLWRESTGHPWIPFTKDKWCGAMLFPLMSGYANNWTHNREAVGLRFLNGHLASL